MFENFECPEGVEPLLFSQLCIYYYADKVPAVVHKIEAEDGLVYTVAITKKKDGKIIFKKKHTKISVQIKMSQLAQ